MFIKNIHGKEAVTEEESVMNTPVIKELPFTEEGRALANEAMREHFPRAARELANRGKFGKDLDRKARKMALRLGGWRLPPGVTIAWATPDEWATGGYRSAAIMGRAQ